MDSSPLVVAYGMGVDSTAMLVAMHERRIRPDLILFADTGDEKPGTYAYFPVITKWLKKVKFPPLIVVRYTPKRAPYETLHGKCLANQTLPSLAFGKHSCSIVFKTVPQDKYVAKWQPARVAWDKGIKVIKAIGYDDSPQDRRRKEKADRACAKKAAEGHLDAVRYHYWSPLQEWGIDRNGCLSTIQRAGLPIPQKSACWFCPASKKKEIIELRDNHPELFAQALQMEHIARNGRHGLDTTVGLGRTFAWSSLATTRHEDLKEETETLRP